MKKNMCIIILVLSMIIGTTTTNGSMITDTKKICMKNISLECESPNFQKDIGKISIKKELVLDKDLNIPLYKTFDSQKNAINEISSNRVVCFIKQTYHFDQINTKNWKDYYNAMYELLDASDCPEWYKEDNSDFEELSCFFDIYENDEKNDEICKIIKSEDSLTKITSDTHFLELLPFDSYLKVSRKYKTELNQQHNVLKAKVNGFDTTLGINYASTYALSPNTAAYGKCKKDCTNFVSQILENGGVSQSVYNDETKGWWHKKVKKLGVITDDSYSISWIRADSFVRYMEIGYSTNFNVLFSLNLQAGDFIASDGTNDGDWDHMGFVTEVRNNTKGYKDYRL